MQGNRREILCLNDREYLYLLNAAGICDFWGISPCDKQPFSEREFWGLTAELIKKGMLENVGGMLKPGFRVRECCNILLQAKSAILERRVENKTRCVSYFCGQRCVTVWQDRNDCGIFGVRIEVLNAEERMKEIWDQIEKLDCFLSEADLGFIRDQGEKMEIERSMLRYELCRMKKKDGKWQRYLRFCFRYSLLAEYLEEEKDGVTELFLFSEIEKQRCLEQIKNMDMLG